MSLPLIITIALSFSQAPSQAPLPTTPDGCVTTIRTFVMNAQRAAQPLTADAVRKIEADKLVMAKRCAAQFTVAGIAEADLPGLIALYGESGEPDKATAAITRALASKTMAAPARAQVLSQAVMAGLREPKSDARNRKLEQWVDALDALPGDLLDVQFTTHSRMNGYYRGDDIDDGIIKHSPWIINRAKSFTPAQRTTYGSPVISAYINMAEAVAGRGDNAGAQALLSEAKSKWGDIRNASAMLDPVVARYALVGTVGAPISAPRWLNAPANSRLPMTGAVTLLEFTAHWCGPCKESYPGLKRLLAKYGPQGFRVVLSTELYGYFGSERGLTAEQEIERDKEYWAHEGLAVPIAIEDMRKPPVRNADGTFTYFDNPNDKAYEVGGIPQIHLIDRQGRIRLIMVGYDDANEQALGSLIEKLLKEK